MLSQKIYIGCTLSFCLLATTYLVDAKNLIVTASEYGDKWPFIVDQGELECKINAVVMHTSRGTYSINGKAMSQYEGKYPTWRKIAKPYPGLNDPRAKMSPPNDLIKRGLELCR